MFKIFCSDAPSRDLARTRRRTLVFDFVSAIGIEAAACLLLTSSREVAYTLQIADDTSHVVDILAAAIRTLLEIAFVDMSALVADSVRDIEREVVASLLSCDAQELAILSL